MNNGWRPEKSIPKDLLREWTREPSPQSRPSGPDWSQPPVFRVDDLRGVFGPRGLSHMVNDRDDADIVVFEKTTDKSEPIWLPTMKEDRLISSHYIQYWAQQEPGLAERSLAFLIRKLADFIHWLAQGLEKHRN